MSKVFIGGSRKIARLPQSVMHRLENIISADLTVLIGDASGVDRCVQQYLFEKRYRNVIVFCTGNTCRNNVGQWETRNVVPSVHSRGFHFYAVKDLQMAQEASYGFMIWDAKSKGTLNNVLNLLQADKKVLVYFAPTHSFQLLRSAADLEEMLNRCAADDLVLFTKELPLKQFLQKAQPQKTTPIISAVQLNFNTVEVQATSSLPTEAKTPDRVPV